MNTEATSAIDVARRVTGVAEGLGLRVAVFGGFALAVHGYDRYTGDIDLVLGNDTYELTRLNRALVAAGFKTALRYPEPGDPVEGCIDIIDENPVDPDLPVIAQVVNSPQRWSSEAYDAAIDVTELGLRVVDLPHLVLFKLVAAHNPRGRHASDVRELLERNPERVAEVIAACERWAMIDKLRSVAGDLLPKD